MDLHGMQLLGHPITFANLCLHSASFVCWLTWRLTQNPNEHCPRIKSADTCNDSHFTVWDCFLFLILPAIQHNAPREHTFIMRASRMFPNHMNHDPW